MNFRKYILTEYTPEELREIARCGCEMGVRDLIYYTDTTKLYGEYCGDIHAIIGEYMDETGEWPLHVCDKLGDFTQFANYAVWFAVEYVAHEYCNHHDENGERIK
jgi:hypothetical protein